MYQFTMKDLEDFAKAWVNLHCEDSPGSEGAGIMKERIFKELLRVFDAANEPLEV
jgi:hypothetical protein